MLVVVVRKLCSYEFGYAQDVSSKLRVALDAELRGRDRRVESGCRTTTLEGD